MPAPRKYPAELRERAVRLVFEIRAESGEQRGAISKVANQLGLNLETLRKWVNQAEIDQGHRLGLSTDERRHMRELEKENRELRRANEILKAAAIFFRGGARPPTAEVTAFIDAHRERFGVEPICKTLQVAPSTHYDHKSRPPSLRAVRDSELSEKLVETHKRNRSVYGLRKLWQALVREDVDVGRDHVGRLMRNPGLTGVIGGKKKRTTIPDPQAEPPADLVDRNFRASEPNRLWVADLTYVSTWSGFCYVAFIIDVYSRMIVGWQCSTTLRAELCLDALEQAIWRRGRELTGLVHHSDRGSQYLSIRYTERLADEGAVTSVGSRGDSYDNAMAESVNSRFKLECVWKDGPWRGRSDLELATASWVAWWNDERLHGELGYIPPAEFEQIHYRHQQRPALAVGNQ